MAVLVFPQDGRHATTSAPSPITLPRQALCLKASAQAFALTLAALSGVAQAETAVSISGLLDMSVEHGKYDRGVSATRAQSGFMTPSRITFRASEDLGGGLTAFMFLESGINVDNGTAAGGTTLFNRGSLVGLRGDWGQMALGRQYAPMFWVAIRSEASTFAFCGCSVLLNVEHFAVTGRSGVAGYFNNMVHYRTPTWHGWNAELSYSMGTEQSGANQHDGVNKGVNLQYEQGAIWAGYGYNEAIAHEAVDLKDRVQRTQMVAAKYNLPDWGVGANVVWTDNMIGGPNPGDARAMVLTGRMAAGVGEINLGVGSISESLGRRMVAAHAGYVYFLSKRTALYTFAVRLQNNSVGNRGLANLYSDYRLVKPDFDPHALAMGIRHTF